MSDALLRWAPMAVVLPLVGGTVCALLPRGRSRVGAVLAAAFAAASLLVVLPLARAGWGRPAAEALTCALAGGRIHLRLDALAALGLALAMAFGFLVAVYSIPFMKDRPGARVCSAGLLWTLGLAAGAFLAGDLLVLLVFWGLLGVTLYLMVGAGGSDAAAAAKKTFILVGGSDCFLLLGIAILWLHTGTLRMGAAPMPVTGPAGWTAFLCFVGAAFAKAGVMPLHSWVPDCGEKAPIPVTAFLPASLDKLLGIYLLARVCLGLFRMTPAANTLLMLAGAGTVICAVMMALLQHDLKRLLSYHAVSQVGYMVLGLGSGTVIGIAGGLFHMLNHAIYKSCLFLCAGSVERQAGSTDMDRLGGLARAMPVTFASCFVAAMSISGLPPLNGFFSKWMVYQGIVEGGRGGDGLWVLWLTAAMLGSALTLASFVKVLHAVFLCKPAADLAARNPREAPAAMWMPVALLAALCVLLGLVAWRFPLRGAILPAVGGLPEIPGNWMSIQAAVLMGVAFALGLLAYRLSTARRPRECETYIGGEIMEEVHARGPDSPALRDVEVTGVDFYRTFEEMAPFRAIFRTAKGGAFDVYDTGSRALFYVVGILRAAHGGNLLVYLTWFLAGLAVVSWLLLRGGGAL